MKRSILVCMSVYGQDCCPDGWKRVTPETLEAIASAFSCAALAMRWGQHGEVNALNDPNVEWPRELVSIGLEGPRHADDDDEARLPVLTNIPYPTKKRTRTGTTAP